MTQALSQTSSFVLPLHLAFTGEKGHGKDTVVSLLLSHGFDHQIIRFADGLKEMLRAFYRTSGLDAVTIERKLEGDLKEVPCEHLGGQTPRHAMQTLGTEWRNLVYEGMWRRQTRTRVEATETGSMIPDMRFPEENGELLAKGFFSVRVERPMARNAASSHSSETQIKQLLVHAVVLNDGTLEDLAQKVILLLAWLSAGLPWPAPSKDPELVF